MAALVTLATISCHLLPSPPHRAPVLSKHPSPSYSSEVPKPTDLSNTLRTQPRTGQRQD